MKKNVLEFGRSVQVKIYTLNETTRNYIRSRIEWSRREGTWFVPYKDAEFYYIRPSLVKKVLKEMGYTPVGKAYWSDMSFIEYRATV